VVKEIVQFTNSAATSKPAAGEPVASVSAERSA
jgi:hypothetical protein